MDWEIIQATFGFGMLLSGIVILGHWIKAKRRKVRIRRVLYKQD